MIYIVSRYTCFVHCRNAVNVMKQSSRPILQPIPQDADWEQMISLHRARQAKLQLQGSLGAHFIEGLRFDVDILRHAFGRWVSHVDRRY